MLSICKHSAPVYVQARHLKRKVPLGPCQAEYTGMTNGVKAVMWFRNLLAAIGYPQTNPTPLYQDNTSAKNPAESPTIQRRSKHIEMFEHANRLAVSDGVIKIIHQPTADRRADILTKPMGLLPFTYQRSTKLPAQCLILSLLVNHYISLNTLFFKVIKLTRACYIYNTRTFTVYTSHHITFT